MVSFVIAAKDRAKREAYAKEYCSKHTIDRFDITTVERDLTAKPIPQSIGIEDVKKMQKKLFLKPIRGQTKAIIIEEAHLLTPEAQNALLKVLEEPPAQTIIILSSKTKEALLPTILSRCQIIVLEETSLNLSEKELSEMTDFIESLPTLSIAERLKEAEQLAKDKDKAILWIEKLILVLRNHMLQNPNIAITESIRTFQSLQLLLRTTNVNTRFAIETTFLSL